MMVAIVMLRTFTGKTWKEVLNSEAGRSYFSYMKENSKNKGTAEEAARALQWYAQNS